MATLPSGMPPHKPKPYKPKPPSLYPLERLKFAKRIRAVADSLTAPGGPDGGNVFLLHVDADGIIHVENLLANQRDRCLRMIGLLATAQAQLMEMLSHCSCGDD